MERQKTGINTHTVCNMLYYYSMLAHWAFKTSVTGTVFPLLVRIPALPQ